MCLFQGSPKRTVFNYTQYMYSNVPPEEPGGGGYAVITISLSSLWEDFQHLRNIWSQSNTGLPLVRYLGCDLYFYQNASTDYAVEINRCPPMKDFKYTHADIAPNRMLIKRNTIKVPSTETKKRRKPYKKIRVKPPNEFIDKWYFQKDICDFPLVMIMATAVDLRYPYGKSDWQSNNISLICLNPLLFQNQDFQNFTQTHGYFPKPNTYLYASRTHNNTLKETDSIIYLGNTLENQLGTEYPLSNVSIKGTSKKDWGNPFHHDILNEESYKIFTATTPPSQLKNKNGDTKIDPSQFTLLGESLLKHIRYNPEKDTGTTNKLYMIANFHNSSWDAPPEQSNILYSGFPFYDIIFGYLDWQEKIHEVQKIQENYILCMQSDTFNEKLYAYIPLDWSFLHGFGTYKDDDSTIKITNYENNHWYPQIRFQLETINQLGLSGPGCPRPRYNTYLQAQMKYKFRFKWGGCPKTLEKPFDPCLQPTWNMPSYLNERLQIQNPSTNPETEIQDFDWRRDYIKKSTIERIQKYTETDKPIQLFTESRHSAQPFLQETNSETSDSETETQEEQASLQEQIHLLKRKQRLLKHRLLKRLRLQSIE